MDCLGSTRSTFTDIVDLHMRSTEGLKSQRGYGVVRVSFTIGLLSKAGAAVEMTQGWATANMNSFRIGQGGFAESVSFLLQHHLATGLSPPGCYTSHPSSRGVKARLELQSAVQRQTRAHGVGRISGRTGLWAFPNGSHAALRLHQHRFAKPCAGGGWPAGDGNGPRTTISCGWWMRKKVPYVLYILYIRTYYSILCVCVRMKCLTIQVTR